MRNGFSLLRGDRFGWICGTGGNRAVHLFYDFISLSFFASLSHLPLLAGSPQWHLFQSSGSFCLCRTVFGSPCISSFLLIRLSRYPRFPLSPSWSIPPFTHPLSFSSCLLSSCLSVNVHVSFPLSLGKASALASGTAEVYAEFAADTHTHGHIIKAF